MNYRRPNLERRFGIPEQNTGLNLDSVGSVID